MPYQLTYSLKPGYLEVDLRVAIVAEQELEEALARWREVAGLCRTLDRTRVLVFMAFTGNHGVEVRFRLAKGAGDIGWSPDLKLAVVIADAQQFIEHQFTETAMNSLEYEMKLFLKKRPAKKWLLA